MGPEMNISKEVVAMSVGSKTFRIADCAEANKVAKRILARNASQGRCHYRIQNLHYFGQPELRVWKERFQG